MKYKDMTQRTVPDSILKELNAVHDLRIFLVKRTLLRQILKSEISSVG